MQVKRNLHTKERGTALLEFALCLSLFWTPLFLGTAAVGFDLVQAIQAMQVCRDAGHMYAFGTDFSQTSNKYLLASLGPGLNIDATGSAGNTVVMLSTITYIDDSICPNGRYSGGSCRNYHKAVFSRWIVVGNGSLHQSAFRSSSTPPVTNSSGDVTNYWDASGAVAVNFSPNVIAMNSSSQLAYVSELYERSPNPLTGFVSSPWVTAMSVF